MRAAALALLALLAAPAAAVGVHDAGAATLRGHATDLVVRTLVLDLWDAGQPLRSFGLRALPDGDALPGVEARARPVRGAEAPWRALEDFRLAASGDAKAKDRGWDGLYEVQVRARLPNVERARLALALVEEAPGVEGVALTTHLEAQLLTLRAWTEPGPRGSVVAARVDGGKPAAQVEAVAGDQRWPLRLAGDAWRADAPAGLEQVRVVARFADGGVLEGAPFPLAASPPPPAPLEQPLSDAPSAPPQPPASLPPASGEPPQPPPRAGAGAAPVRALPGPPISLAVSALALLPLLSARRGPPSL